MKITGIFFLLFIIVFPLYSENIYIEDEENNIFDNIESKYIYHPIILGKIGYSFFSDSLVMGFDIAIYKRNPEQWEWIFIKHIFGIDYQFIFSNNESILRINYIRQLMPLFPLGGPGISFFYNITNNYIGISPQIGLHMLFISCFYRYNIIFNNTENNFHEIVLSLNVILPLFRK